MDKNLFLKNMEEMIQIAKTNGNQIDHKELLDYFSDYELNIAHNYPQIPAD